MMLNWFNAREAAEVGTALADQFAPQTAPAASRGNGAAKGNSSNALQELLRSADSTVRKLRLNVYKKAKFANSFKWRLIENGVSPKAADELTQALIMHLSQQQDDSAPATAAPRRDHERIESLRARGNKALAAGDHAQVFALFTEFDALDPGRPDVLNTLGVALCHLQRIPEAEQRFREALEIDPNHVEALSNLAGVVQANPQEAEQWLRRALKVNPKYPRLRTKLGIALLSSAQTNEAKAAFRKALKLDPNDADAMIGMAKILMSEGRFEETESKLKRALKIEPRSAVAWAALQGIRKMTLADREWVAKAEEIAGSGPTLWEEAELRFAIGKYYDDVEEYAPAFASYRRGNELLKSVSDGYDREAHARFADDMIRIYTREMLAAAGTGGSASAQPIFVLGMPRSGTSLTEQIIASHPAARGAGEPEFWLEAARTHQGDLRQGQISEPVKHQLAEDYLRFLERRCGDARRIVDKTPANSDLVGFIHSVLPQARIIRMRRDPIDSCLSCYFQRFSAGQTFTLDLGDLAAYYRTHQRLMNHWRSALPPGTMLEVPYEELVADQESWTRKIIDFIGLEWDERCLAFHETQRSVATASAWQVRQKIYKQSVQRWRHYEQFIGPLKGLRD
jgi:Flp pilus assembly protein TadD